MKLDIIADFKEQYIMGSQDALDIYRLDNVLFQKQREISRGLHQTYESPKIPSSAQLIADNNNLQK